MFAFKAFTYCHLIILLPLMYSCWVHSIMISKCAAFRRMRQLVCRNDFISRSAMYSISSTVTSSRDHELASTGTDTFVSTTLMKPPVGRAKGKQLKLVPVATLTEAMAIEELRQLNETIALHDALYYDLAEPEISDSAYDKLLRRAKDIVGRFDSLKHLVARLNTIGSHGGGKLFPDFQHNKKAPMISLDNSFSEEDILKFINRACESCNISLDSNQPFPFIIEPKIDGLSLALRYHNGKLVGAGTRGNGIIGEDVTQNAKYISGVPQTIKPLLPFMEIRGECYINRNDFLEISTERMQTTQKSSFATSRNAAAGSLRLIDEAVIANRKLRFFAYSLLASSNNNDDDQNGDRRFDELKLIPLEQTQSKSLEALRQLGFDVASPCIIDDQVSKIFIHCTDIQASRLLDYPYDIDGAVVKLDRFEDQAKLGETSKYPRWATAFKFPADDAITTVWDIVVQVGRTGTLTPVAVLSPVRIGGVMVERATLHNEDEVNRLKIQVGSQVRIKRAGDVIPKIVATVDDLRGESRAFEGYKLPTACPVCGSKVHRGASDASALVSASENISSDQSNSSGSIMARCSGGWSCSAQAIESIRHFCSRDAADISGLGPERVEHLYKLGIVNNYADIYQLRKFDQLDISSLASAGHTSSNDVTNQSQSRSLRSVEGWGDLSVNNLLAAIDRRRSLPFARFLYGLGVNHIGLSTAKLIANEFGDFSVFWNYLEEEMNKLPMENVPLAITEAADVSVVTATVDDSEPLSLLGNNLKPEVKKSRRKEKRVLPGQRLHDIKGVGPKAIQSLFEFAKSPEKALAVKRLLEAVIVECNVLPAAAAAPLNQEQVIRDDNLLIASNATDFPEAAGFEAKKTIVGKGVVFTGKLNSMSRPIAEKHCTALGGIVQKAVVKSTGILVVAQLEGSLTSKLKASIEQGIEIWSESDWMTYLQQNNIETEVYSANQSDSRAGVTYGHESKDDASLPVPVVAHCTLWQTETVDDGHLFI